MIIRIQELKLPPDHTKQMLEREIKKILRINGELPEYEIIRRSVDARRKPEIRFVYTVDVKAALTRKEPGRIRNKKVSLTEKKEYRFPFLSGTQTYNASGSGGQGTYRPVVVGSGPAGMFCALMLARAGLCPIILERGEAVDERMESVNRFWETGELNPQSNVQFGEGGAGTFSDGKLNTLIKDSDGKIRFVLKEFVRAGAPEDILYHHKPHIGTDILVSVVKNIRNEIISLGGEYRFCSTLTGLNILPQEKEGQPRFFLSINGADGALSCNELILAVGHSARDTVSMLYGKNLPMEAKAFAVGLRIEHRQETIQTAMYGEDCPYEMEPAPYKVTHKCADGRGVYSFCMCPGGYVVNASSEENGTAVNGMSCRARNSENANSAIVVTVSPEDYHAQNPLSGIEFQRELERAAYRAGGGKIPVQRFGDFCDNKPTTKFGSVQPVMKGQFCMANLRGILPEECSAAIIEGIHSFARPIPGFDSPDALLSGVESRTSSPVRIARGTDCQSAVSGIFPCGEGAGYAGGITSAAVDGIRVAEAVCRERGMA